MWRPVLNHWSLDGVYTFRTATPVDITYTRDLGYGVYSFRPDPVAGVPLYLNNENIPGGRVFNPDAFTLPSVYPGRQGALGRNVLRGFPLNQINFTIRREFPLVERLRLQLRAEMFNALNHPNFADPVGLLQSSQFGYSTGMLSQDLGRGGVNGGLNPLYQVGGPRSIQLAMLRQRGQELPCRFGLNRTKGKRMPASSSSADPFTSGQAVQRFTPALTSRWS
jgi:hypothetical protein